MIPWLRALLWDQSAAERYFRAALMLGGTLAAQGVFDGLPKWVGAVAMAGAVFIGAGQKNPAEK